MTTATKNLMDSSDSKRPLIFDDKTGQYVSGVRLELADTLQFVHDTYRLLLATRDPSIHQYSVHFAVQAVCQHMGWLPYEIAAAEQYATLLASQAAPAAAG